MMLQKMKSKVSEFLEIMYSDAEEPMKIAREHF